MKNILIIHIKLKGTRYRVPFYIYQNKGGTNIEFEKNIEQGK